MSSQLYALEKMSAAVRSLAVGPEPLPQRLEYAFLAFHTLSPKDFPDKLASRFAEIHDALTREKAVGNEGRVRATLAKMDKSTAQDIAIAILGLEFDLREHLDRGQRR